MNAHEDPETANRIMANQKLVGEHDQFVEYIHHVESKSRHLHS